MLIFEMTITVGEDRGEDDRGNDYTIPITEKFVMKASRDNLGSLIRGIRRIMEHGLASECYVRVKEHDQRMSYGGSVFEPWGWEDFTFDELMAHHEKYLMHVLEMNGI